jgi:hypothetical protein
MTAMFMLLDNDWPQRMIPVETDGRPARTDSSPAAAGDHPASGTGGGGCDDVVVRRLSAAASSWRLPLRAGPRAAVIGLMTMS